MIARPLPLALLVLTGVLASCRKPAVESYRVPKETPAPGAVASTPDAGASAAPGQPASPMIPGAAPAGGGMANTAVATASGPGLTWTAPAHWKSKAGSAMRKGTYTISGDAGEAELSITAFPGDVGGDLANLNRWRGQLQLPPISQAEFASAAQQSERNGLKMTVADIVATGANAQRITGAMIPHSGSTWFFKLMGPDATVAKEKAAFLAFLDTIKPAAPAGK